MKKMCVFMCIACICAALGVAACGSTAGKGNPAFTSDGGETGDAAIGPDAGEKTDAGGGGPDASSGGEDAQMPQCASNCDCPQGVDCVAGQCTLGDTPVYCCAKAGCPEGEACKDASGAAGICPAAQQCGNRCDCDQGWNCVDGQCVLPGAAPSYCCAKPGCPEGEACLDGNGEAGICPAAQQCAQRCDCDQGWDCAEGQCVLPGAAPAYCCEKEGCTAQAECVDSSGNAGVCPSLPPACALDCDCNQGYACEGGECVFTPGIPAYCCVKEGCPLGMPCTGADGGFGMCSPENITTCERHCDCNQGEGCFNGICAVGPQLTYCCDKPDCPDGEQCFSERNVPGICGGGQPQCASPCDCPQGQSCLNGQCAQEGQPVYCCDNAGCPWGQACVHENGEAGRCQQIPNRCQSNCDCEQGETCEGIGAGNAFGLCVQGEEPGYCCEKDGCPRGAACMYSSGEEGVCGEVEQHCRSRCDCPQGQDCIDRTCTAAGVPAYCCGNRGCPDGQPCRYEDGSPGICQFGPTDCLNHCDCPQGFGCMNGACFELEHPILCCSNPDCPEVHACYNEDGSSGTCLAPPPECATHCDCDQGRDCVGDQCVQGVLKVYCCDNDSCPIGRRCLFLDGTPGICGVGPSPCRSDCDCPQGKMCLNGECNAGNQPIYCCEKPGCPEQQMCIHEGGGWGYCPGGGVNCATACDCQPGSGCAEDGTCNESARPRYCCENNDCPDGQMCQYRDGNVGFCR